MLLDVPADEILDKLFLGGKIPLDSRLLHFLPFFSPQLPKKPLISYATFPAQGPLSCFVWLRFGQRNCFASHHPMVVVGLLSPSCEQRWILLYTPQRPSTNNGHPCKVLGLSPHLLNLSPNPTQRNESTGREIACLKLPSRWEKWGLCWV